MADRFSICLPFTLAQESTSHTQHPHGYSWNIHGCHSPASIVGLLLARGPSAISRFVIAIIVDAINRVKRGWPFANISGKYLKTVIPSLADTDPSTTVSRIAFVIFALASIFHASPNQIETRTGFAVTLTRISKFFHVVLTETTAAFGWLMLPSQRPRANLSFVSTGTFAVPPCSRFSVWYATNNYKPSKFLSNQINKIWHKGIS